MNNTLSICIPTVNSIKLNICLEKIIPQVKDFCIPIYIQDNNPENKFNIEKYEYKYISYYRNNKNIGADKNMIAVLAKANTEYALWLGDDDYILPGMIQHMLDVLKHKPDLMILGYTNKQSISSRYCEDNIIYFSNSINFYKNFEPNPIYFGNCIVKTTYISAFDENKYIGTLHAYNAYIMSYLALIEKANIVNICIDRNVYIYRNEKDKTWKQNYLKVMLISVFKYYFLLPNPYRKYRYHMCFKRIMYYIKKIILKVIYKYD